MTPKEKKSLQMQVIREKIGQDFLVLLSYKSLDVQQQTDIRQMVRQAGGELFMVKNTLTKKVSEEYGLGEIIPYLKGPTTLLTSSGDFIRSAKALQEICKKYPEVEIKAGMLNKKLITPKNIQEIASLPSREVLIAKLLSTISAPLSQLVTVLQAPLQNLLTLLSKISNSKEKND